MTLYLGSDHGGYQLKTQLIPWLEAIGYTAVDCGATQLDPTDDYPTFAQAVGEAVVKAIATKKPALGILLCKSGGGVAIAANKIAGIRAVEAYDEKTVRHARTDNDANVFTFSGLWQSLDDIKILIAVLLNTPFSREERHQRRLAQIAALETNAQ